MVKFTLKGISNLTESPAYFQQVNGIYRKDGALALRRIRLYSGQLMVLAKQLERLHDNGVLHCDLAIDNVRIGEGLEDAWLIDFGFAEKVTASSGQPSINAQWRGKFDSVAPEIIATLGSRRATFNVATEMYSFAFIAACFSLFTLI